MISSLVAVLFAITFAPAQQSARPKMPEGVLPVGAGGKALNLDFEKGTLDDWTATGGAFAGQPIRGEIDKNRQFGADKKAEMQGQYWIGGYEKLGDAPTGTLTSTAFQVTHPWATYRIAGGRANGTRVELVRKDTGAVFHRRSGQDVENLRPVLVDLQKQQGKPIFIRIVDESTGGWGHVNFDDFRFHKTRPKLPRYAGDPPAADEYTHDGLPPEDAAQAMIVPEGFEVTLCAGEPDVHQPIAMAVDDRGRLWVAEAYEYPIRAKEGKGRDRILIFEDKDGDGKFDSSKVFVDKLNLVSGIEVGFGGVWVGAAPYFLFIPDRDGDDRPDGPPQKLLDGWGYHDTHETLNAFIWGPDGWLYGCHGVFTHSRVGKPGTPERDRIPLNAAIWRYHPTRHEFEIFAHGSSNPWGVDFDDNGQAFCTACVIPHLYHVIQGARYQRQAGAHFNRYTYDDIKTIADHRHYVGGNPHQGNERSTSAGGGHAHSGAMIYLGGTWPQKYRNQIFMNNIHGQRINMDVLKASGSGFVGSHGPDFLMADDRWSQIVNLRYTSDGNVYMIDWYDKNACHRTDANVHDRTNGRIFKVSYHAPGGKATSAKTKSAAPVNIAKLTDMQLVALMSHTNDWYVRHGRRNLQERAAARAIDSEAVSQLREMALGHNDTTRRLRAIWALHVIHSSKTPTIDQTFLSKLAGDSSPYVRGWALQILGDHYLDARGHLPPAPAALVAAAADDSSPVVRLYAASLAGRLATESRGPLLAKLISHAEDAGDHNLPLMYWYALEPLAGDRPDEALALAEKSPIPVLFGFTLRRILASGSPASLAVAVDALQRQSQPQRQVVVLDAINTALRGRRRVTAPSRFAQVYARLARSSDSQVRSQLATLAVTFGDESVMAQMRSLLADGDADLPVRQEALAALVRSKDSKLPPILHKLLADEALRTETIRGLASYDDSATPKKLLDIYSSLSQSQRQAALATLGARREYALALLDAVGAKTIAATDLSADLVRQLHNFGDEDITARLNKLWGPVRSVAADKAKLIEHYQRMLTAKNSSPPDLALGRAVFAKTCQKCHAMYATGGKIGPDLTGSNRANLDYLLSNVVDPSAVMAKEYMPSVLAADGRLITGIIKADDKNSITVQTADDVVVVPRDEIEEGPKASEKSMMPDDLLGPLSDLEVRALVAFMATKSQTPILATKDTANDFFSGRDLSLWRGDEKLWKVEGGEIVGRTEGLKRNEFLVSEMVAGDFRLTLEVKLVDNRGNSGVQFRSQPTGDGDVKGYQADIGAGWWGKLYEEHGRALLWSKSAEAHVKSGEWNTYEITAVGSRIRTKLGGKLCVDLDDPEGARSGVFALQLHSGGPTEVRFRNFKLEVGPDVRIDEAASE